MQNRDIHVIASSFFNSFREIAKKLPNFEQLGNFSGFLGDRIVLLFRKNISAVVITKKKLRMQQECSTSMEHEIGRII